MAHDAELPTGIQLGVSNSQMIWRGLALRCPACAGRRVIIGWFKIADRCPTCDLRIERIEGHVIGYIDLNIMVCFTLTFIVLLVGSTLMIPDIQVGLLLILALIPAAIGPIAFAPGSRTTWTAIDLILRPLTAGEIDPRFVVVDPARDRPPPS